MPSFTHHVYDATRLEVWAEPLREAFETLATKTLRTDVADLEGLLEAMRYAVLGGGKRIRALLAYASGALCQARREDLDRVALALEFVHAYSLVHDDLPCMDNDTLRRGKPTCHVRFGVAQAMLAGDALQPEAFALLTTLSIEPSALVELVAVFAEACGKDGMCGGQAIDLANVGLPMPLERLRRMHRMKTGALIRASVRMGALCGKREQVEALTEPLEQYASSLGLGFQVVDDILDVTSDTATLGKTVGKDALNHKPTYVSLIGLEQSRRLAEQCRENALAALDAMALRVDGRDRELERLADLADYMIVARTR